MLLVGGGGSDSNGAGGAGGPTAGSGGHYANGGNAVNGTGSGGGGSGGYTGGSGGSGRIVIRYPDAYSRAISYPGGSEILGVSGFIIYQFDGPGNLNWS